MRMQTSQHLHCHLVRSWAEDLSHTYGPHPQKPKKMNEAVLSCHFYCPVVRNHQCRLKASFLFVSECFFFLHLFSSFFFGAILESLTYFTPFLKLRVSSEFYFSDLSFWLCLLILLRWLLCSSAVSSRVPDMVAQYFNSGSPEGGHILSLYLRSRGRFFSCVEVLKESPALPTPCGLTDSKIGHTFALWLTFDFLDFEDPKWSIFTFFHGVPTYQKTDISLNQLLSKSHR